MSESYKITLKPVYSQTVATPDGVKLPENWSLSWHQVETLKALQNPNIDVVFNTAMTGDGKSLAAYLEVLQGEFSAIGLYPTNELARDQEIQIQGYIEEFQPRDKPRVVRLSGADLEIYAENEGLRKSAAIATLTNQREALLTNPDIFHYLHRGAYIIPGDSPDKLWGKIDKDFDLFIFDEFHVFAAPQIASIINTMLLIRCTNRRKKFLFLSATPDKNLITRLQAAGFRCQEINPLEKNKYQFPNTAEQENELRSQGWRQVARTISLNFIPLEPAFKASETWLRENSNLILAHFQQYPRSKGAIILNSIAAVKRLKKFLTPLFQAHDLTVEENTGLTGKAQREESLKADLVIGTSTIDIGVDFKINFLIFESSDAGNFIQRLGRLGRHEGYEKDSQKIKFENFKAFALVPKFLVERLFKESSLGLKDNGVYNRPNFHQIISSHYREIEVFYGYYRRWGAVQSVQLCWELKHKTIQQQYASSIDAFSQACELVFDTKLKCHAGRIKKWFKEWQEMGGKQGNPIANDAASFRGSSPLLCGLYDEQEENKADGFKTYNLPGILSNLEIEAMTETAFMRALKETAERTRQPIAKGRFAHCLAFVKLRGYRDEPLNWKFTFFGDLERIANSWKVQVLKGIGVWQPDNPWVMKIEKCLKKQGLVCYVVPVTVIEARMQLKLPMHFQIYPISDRVHDTTAPFSIAFGQSALLLDLVAPRLKIKDGIHIA
jgi:CRISPR-associated endonuclease/helicase Cas3